VIGPEPARSPVVMIPAPEVPVCPNTAPVALVIAVQRSQPVSVHANAPVPSPYPPVSTMEVVIVVVPPPEVPVAAHVMPASTIPALVHPEAVPVSADLFVGVGPEPASSLIVMVASP